MSMYPHRGMGGVPPGGNGASRLNELLDNIRSEFETQVRQCENYEHQSEPDPAAWHTGRQPGATSSIPASNIRHSSNPG